MAGERSLGINPRLGGQPERVQGADGAAPLWRRVSARLSAGSRRTQISRKPRGHRRSPSAGLFARLHLAVRSGHIAPCLAADLSVRKRTLLGRGAEYIVCFSLGGGKHISEWGSASASASEYIGSIRSAILDESYWRRVFPPGSRSRRRAHTARRRAFGTGASCDSGCHWRCRAASGASPTCGVAAARSRWRGWTRTARGVVRERERQHRL